MSLGTTYCPTVPVGWAASYKLWPVITYSNGNWEVYRRFRLFLAGGEGLREGDYVGDLSMEEFVMGEENFHEGSAGFSRTIEKKIWERFFNWK